MEHAEGEVEDGLTCLFWKSGVAKRKKYEAKASARRRLVSLSWWVVDYDRRRMVGIEPRRMHHIARISMKNFIPIHSQTISELLQPDQTFRELFILILRN
jgi:hypothetical protein